MKARAASDVKEHNRRLVYSLIREQGAISKAAIARRLGLSAPTVIKIVDYFSKSGIVTEAGEGEAALGRKPTLLRFSPEAAYSVGAEYDGVHLRTGLVDLCGRVASIRQSPAPPDLNHIFSSFLEQEVRALIASSGLAWDRVRGLGVGVPGVVHGPGGVISQAPLVGIGERVDCAPLVERLREKLGLPVLVTNDANAAALGELSVRGCSCDNDLIFVGLGRGVGAGIVLDSRLREGPRSSAGEIGYLVFDPRATAGFPGPGWLESAMDLDSFWAEAERDGAPSRSAVERVGDLLALGLANLCVALDVRLVVLGKADKEGFGPALLARLQEGLRRLCPMEVRCDFPAAPEPGVSGAAALAVEAWLSTLFGG